MDLSKATAADFAAFVGSAFQCETADGQVELLLDNIKPLASSGRRDVHVVVDGLEVPPRDPFALTFEGPREPVISQALYRLRHEQLGELQLFISPFRQDHACVLYESILN